MMIDTHCHLSNIDYDNLEEIINHMGSNIMVVSGVDLESNKQAIELTKQYSNIYCTIGFHPTELKDYNEKSINFLEDNINNPKVVGIGEIGLDYHYGKEDEQLQKKAFIDQIKLANKYKKTIVIHSRDAANDTYEILKQELHTKVIIHCYSYSLEMAYNYIQLGAIFGIGGVLTFKNSNKLKEIVEKLDMSKFVLETDSPYLAPEPLRGTKNEPYNIYYVAKKISELKQIPLEKVFEITTNNTLSQFDIKI